MNFFGRILIKNHRFTLKIRFLPILLFFIFWKSPWVILLFLIFKIERLLVLLLCLIPWPRLLFWVFVLLVFVIALVLLKIIWLLMLIIELLEIVKCPFSWVSSLILVILVLIFVLVLLVSFFLLFSKLMDILDVRQLFRQTGRLIRIIKVRILQNLLDRNPFLRVISKHFFEQGYCLRIRHLPVFQVLQKLVGALRTLNLLEFLMAFDPRPGLLIRLIHLIKNCHQMLFSLGVLVLSRDRPSFEPEDKVSREHVLKNAPEGPNVYPVGVGHVQ